LYIFFLICPEILVWFLCILPTPCLFHDSASHVKSSLTSLPALDLGVPALVCHLQSCLPSLRPCPLWLLLSTHAPFLSPPLPFFQHLRPTLSVTYWPVCALFPLSSELVSFSPCVFSHCTFAPWAFSVFLVPGWQVLVDGCCLSLHRTQILALYFLSSQDESIITNFSWNLELPCFVLLRIRFVF
jgi:hypothetical protein